MGQVQLSDRQSSFIFYQIEGAYEIATIHNGHPGYFLSGWEGKD